MIDDHIGAAIAGLTSDARVLSKYMQAMALSSRMNMNRPIPVQRLVTDISDSIYRMSLSFILLCRGSKQYPSVWWTTLWSWPACSRCRCIAPFPFHLHLLLGHWCPPVRVLPFWSLQ